MFFTNVGRTIAWLMVVIGGLRVIIGFAIAFGGDQAMAPIFLGTHSTGEAINKGMLWLLIGASVGMVAEISRSVSAKSEVKEREPS